MTLKVIDPACAANGKRPRAVVLLSGGIDSAVALARCCGAGWDCWPLTVDYGQRHGHEIHAARLIATRYTGPTRVVEVRGLVAHALTPNGPHVPKGRTPAQIRDGGVAPTYVPARNLIFLALATAYAETLGATRVVIGATKEDAAGYPDCRPAFLEAFTAAATLGTDAGNITAWAPLAEYDKAMVVKLALALMVPLELTHTCYDPGGAGVPCGRCDACTLRRAAFATVGAVDPLPYPQEVSL